MLCLDLIFGHFLPKFAQSKSWKLVRSTLKLYLDSFFAGLLLQGLVRKSISKVNCRWFQWCCQPTLSVCKTKHWFSCSSQPVIIREFTFSNLNRQNKCFTHRMLFGTSCLTVLKNIGFNCNIWTKKWWQRFFHFSWGNHDFDRFLLTRLPNYFYFLLLKVLGRQRLDRVAWANFQ